MFQRRMHTTFLVLLYLLMFLVLMAGVATAVSPTGVQLNQTRLTISRGTHAVLEAQVTPADSDSQGLVWLSGNPSIVRVTPETSGTRARIDGLAAGTATVEVRLPDGTATASCQVTVRVPVEGVSVSQEAVTLIRGQETDLAAVVRPGDATNKRLRWSVDQESVVEFVDNGVTAFGNHATVWVRGVSAGSATVTVESEDGKKRDTVAFQVIVPLEAIGFNNKELTMDVEETVFVETVLNPSDTTSTGLLYETSDASVVTVDEEGLISGVGEGTARVIVRSQDNELISDYVQITVLVGGGQGQAISEETATPEDSEEESPTGEENSATEGVSNPSEEPAPPEKEASEGGFGLWAVAGVVLVGIVFGAAAGLKKKQKPKNIPIQPQKPVKPQAATMKMASASEDDAPELTKRITPLPVIESGERVLVQALSGEFAGQVIELAEDTLVIGRDPQFSHLVYPGYFEVISRKHVVIEHDRESGRCYLRDLSSSGTYRADTGEKLPYDEPVPFSDGQRFYLGVPGELYEIRFDDSLEGEAEK